MTIREARERMGKTQSEMAALLGITRNYLALIETGKRSESTDLLTKALELLTENETGLSLEQWRDRALNAESRLANLKKALGTLLETY